MDLTEVQLEDCLQMIWKYGWDEMEKVFSEPVKDILKTKMEERMKKVFARAELGLRADLLAGPVFALSFGHRAELGLRADLLAGPVFGLPGTESPPQPQEEKEKSPPPPTPSCPEVVVPAVQSQHVGSNDKKKAQREAEKKKREENAIAGIFPQDLLTEENLHKWRSLKHSNAYIAREFVGCREEEVAKALKKFSIV
jgi:hypothetical protein